jgi:hypothetical protein
MTVLRSCGRCCLFFAAIQAQAVTFDLHTFQDCPVVLTTYSPSMLRSEGGRRQFVTAKNVSDKVAVALLFQLTVPGTPRDEIVSLERVSVVFRPRETKRLSVNVEDVWTRLQNSSSSGATARKPVMSIVAVEFMDGSLWNAPTGGGHR